MSDERLGHANRTDERTKRRTAEDARGPSEDELVERFRDELFSNVLPSLPKIPGYHVCWCSTTNQADSLQQRELKGYERIKPEEIPGFEHMTMTSGPFAGNIVLNELIAMKLPERLFYRYMQIAHHERPMAHQDKMRSQLQAISHNGDGVKVELADGSISFLRASQEPRPMFAE